MTYGRAPQENEAPGSGAEPAPEPHVPPDGAVGEAEQQAGEVVGLAAFRPSTDLLIETTASWLAKAIALVFAFVVIGYLVLAFMGLWWAYGHAPAARPADVWAPDFQQVASIAETLLPYLATPLGVALGYYFTKRSTGNARKSDTPRSSIVPT